MEPDQRTVGKKYFQYPVAFPSTWILRGSTFFKWLMYFRHLLTFTILQKLSIPSTSCTLLLGFTSLLIFPTWLIIKYSLIVHFNCTYTHTNMYAHTNTHILTSHIADIHVYTHTLFALVFRWCLLCIYYSQNFIFFLL